MKKDEHGKDTVIATDEYNALEKDGLVYAIDTEGWNRIWKHGEFNNLKIRCVGTEPKITSWINDVKVMEMDGTRFRARKLPDTFRRAWDKPSA